jgi:hypothetical protein
MMDAKRLEFDVTLDEIVDVNMRLVRQTEAYHQQRRRAQWVLGLSIAGGIAVAMLWDGEAPSSTWVATASCAALAGGLASGVLYGRYYDRFVRRYYRRVVDEMYNGANPIHFEFELRDEALWTRSVHSEVVFPWSRLVRIEDVPGSIELWFNPGLAVIRDRAFHSQEDRRAFLDAVRKRLPGSDPR